jgi:hypothetical protein
MGYDKVAKLIQILFLDIIHCPVFVFKTQCFGDWILSPSSDET